MRPIVLILGWAGLEAVVLGIARLGDLRVHAAAFLWLAGAACVLHACVVRYALQASRVAHHSPAWLLGLIVAGGVMLRLPLLGLTPTLSDDIYRYVWDGRVQVAGMNPYRHAPVDPALAPLRDAGWRGINHPDIATVYPPLSQVVFRLGAWIAPTPMAQKALFALLELGVLGLLPLLLRRLGVNPWLSVIYAWHPLVVIETSGSGHNDPLGVLCLLAGLLLWLAGRRLPATLAFALSFLSKFATALLWPFYLLRARKALVLFIAVAGAASLPLLSSPHLSSGLGQYARSWEFNSSLHGLAVSWGVSPAMARSIGAALLAGAGGWLAWKTDDLVRYTLRMIQLAVLLTPVLEPWYLLWLIPLLCARPSWPWLSFSWLALLSYAVLIRFMRDGVWLVPAWVKWVEYGPLYAWMAWRAAAWASKKFGVRSSEFGDMPGGPVTSNFPLRASNRGAQPY